MHLNNRELQNRAQWEAADIRLPAFDRAAMIAATGESPQWVHFGAGNIFRAFPAALQQSLLDKGLVKTGVIAVEGYDYEILDRMYLPHDNLSLLVTLRADGSIGKTVIGSIAESLKADSGDPDEFGRIRAIFRAGSLQMASFTITEKGYRLTDGGGSPLPDVAADFAAGPEKPGSYIGKVAALCYERFSHGALPLALVSMDNCSHNGARLYDAVHTFAVRWTQAGLTEKGFLGYVEDPSRLSFPWTMIDKITPRPDESVTAMLRSCGFADTAGEITQKHTYVAPFVNAEETQYLVVEDSFPNGRPPLEKAGVIFTDRPTVEKVEKMKVSTCLNPLHTALAVFGCLLGYRKISDEMQDADLKKLVERIGCREGLPAVADPGILSPRKFLDEVLRVRIPNPFLPDTPQRIATDTSQKLAVRYGETIKAYLADKKLDIRSLRCIPLVLAGWCRYRMAVDDSGEPFTLSPDPSVPAPAAKLASLRLGQAEPVHERLEPILSDARLFAVNLYEAGLGETVERDFAELAAGRGAVRATLRRILAES